MWLVFVNPVMNFWVPWTVGNLLTRLGTSSVARRALLEGFGWLVNKLNFLTLKMFKTFIIKILKLGMI
jgi:hypothetical protein